MIVKRGFKAVEERKGFVRKGQSLNSNWLYNTNSARVGTVDPEIRNPLLNVINFYLPYSYRILNQWLRYYDKFHPLIRNSLNLHSEVPWSDFDLTDIEDNEIKEFYEDMVSDLDLLNFFTASTREYFLIGESVPYKTWDYELNCFSSLVILNPDYIIVKSNPFTGKKNIYRDFTDDLELRSIINSSDQEDQLILQDLPAEVLEAMQTQKKLLIDENSVGYIANKTSEYEPRGTSLVLACFIPNTLVTLANGTRKEIANIVIGEKVITHTGEAKEVALTMNRDYDGELINLSVDGSSEIVSCTPNHEFYAWNANRLCACGCGQRLTARQRRLGYSFKSTACSKKKTEPIIQEDFKWFAAEDLTVDDFLCTPISNETDAVNKTITSGKARLIGYFLAEGWFNYYDDQRQSITLSFHKDETAWVDDIEKILLDDFGIESNIKVNDDLHNRLISSRVSRKNNSRTDWNNKELVEFLYYHCNERSHSKRLSEEVMRWDKSLQLEILKGYLRGDGCWNSRGIGAATVSKDLGEQIAYLLSRQGVLNRFKVDLISEGIIKRKKYYAEHPDVIPSTKKPGRDTYLVRTVQSHSRAFQESVSLVEDTRYFKNYREIADEAFRLRLDGLIYHDIANHINETFGLKGSEQELGEKRISQILRYREYGIKSEITVKGKLSNSTQSRVLEDLGYIVKPIKTIERTLYKGKVYNLNVDSNHSYLVKSQLVANNCLKDLMYEDKLREAQYAIAGRHILPIEHWTIGEGLNWMPSEEELVDFEQLLQSLGNDPLHSLITPAGYNYAAHGVADKILPLIKEFEFVENRILTAMFTSKAITHGEGPTYSNAAVALEILQSRYDTVRDKTVSFVRKKIFTPVAEANDFYAAEKKEVLGHYRLACNMSQLIRDRKEIEQDIAYQQNVLYASDDKSQSLKSSQVIVKKHCQLNKVIRAIRTSGKRWLIPSFGWRNRINLKDENQRVQFAFKLRDALQLPLRKIYELLRIDFDSSMQVLKEEKKNYPEFYEDEKSDLFGDKGSSSKNLGDKPMIKDDLSSSKLRSPLAKTEEPVAKEIE